MIDFIIGLLIALIVGTLIVAIIWWLFKGKKTSTVTNTSATPAPTTPPPAPTPAPKKNKLGVIAGVIGVALLIVLMVYFCTLVYNAIWGSSKEKDDSNSSCNSGIEKEVSDLRFDGLTPCNPPIDYKFELDTQGDSISLKFPGVDSLVHYSGKGTIKVPPREFGPVKILSLNPKTQARVRIWEVIKVKIKSLR